MSQRQPEVLFRSLISGGLGFNQAKILKSADVAGIGTEERPVPRFGFRAIARKL